MFTMFHLPMSARLLIAFVSGSIIFSISNWSQTLLIFRKLLFERSVSNIQKFVPEAESQIFFDFLAFYTVSKMCPNSINLLFSIKSPKSKLNSKVQIFYLFQIGLRYFQFSENCFLSFWFQSSKKLSKKPKAKFSLIFWHFTRFPKFVPIQ